MSRKFLLSLFLLLAFAGLAQAEGPLLKRFREWRMERNGDRALQTTADIVSLAGMNVAIWSPQGTVDPAPLVLFSHGFGGCKTQSTFLMEALAGAGYLVAAPDHKDAMCGRGIQGIQRPEEKFRDYNAWTEETYKDRGEDLKKLYAALKAHDGWRPRIDWQRLALAGHSLGGYTVLGLAGGWPSWAMPNVKAVLALSPYAGPYAQKDMLKNLKAPVMYQGGTRDKGITPGLKAEGGAYDRTPSPAYFIEFRDTGHFGWTDLQSGAHDLVTGYSLWFFNHALYANPEPLSKIAGVTTLRQK